MSYCGIVFAVAVNKPQYLIFLSLNILRSTMKKWLLFTSITLLVYACAQDQLSNPLDIQLERSLVRLSPTQDIRSYILPNSKDLDAIPQGAGNPLTPEKVDLGKMLFYETGLALDAKYQEGKNTYSCASCHIPSAGFMPGRAQGIADGGVGFGLNGESREKMSKYAGDEIDAQAARPIGLLNVAFVTNSMWNGKFGANDNNKGTEHLWKTDPDLHVNEMGLDGLEAQNIEGTIVHRMVTDHPYVLDTLGYRAMFDRAFPDVPKEERYGRITTSFALSAYIRTLLPTKAPFQEWLKGDLEAMTEEEKRGALVFFGKAGCYRCHQGGSLNSNEFHALGVKDLYEQPDVFRATPQDKRNFGRGGFTGKQEDMFRYKVPSIYNMKDSPFYFHGSSVRSLEDLVEYFDKGIPENPRVPKENISPYFHPLYLTAQEKADLVQFLAEGLRDPDLQRFAPPAILSGNCFPNNDPFSQSDLGCK